MKKLLFVFLVAAFLIFGVAGQSLAAQTNTKTTQPLLTCNNLIPVSQIRTIVGDNTMHLTSGNEPHSSHLSPANPTTYVDCGYSSSHFYFGVTFDVYAFTQKRWDLEKRIQSTASAITGLGSLAYRGTSVNGWGPYFVISSNKKYIIQTHIHDNKSKFDPNKKNQIQFDTIKIVDANLNKF